MMHNLGRTASFKSYQRNLSIGSPRPSRLSSVSSSVSRRVRVVVVIAYLFTFILAICVSYSFVVPSLKLNFLGRDASKCDFSDGSWIPDEGYPLYNATECPFAEQGFNCLGNGRKDQEYIKWRWKPRNCDLVRFNIRFVLESLRNRRVVFVGDSMSRTQWESLICLLMTGVDDKKSVYEVNGSKITKRIRFLGVRFSSYNFTIEFFRSVFLVQHGWMPRHAPMRVRSTLILDKLDDISNQWVNSDVLIFNTGQWWVPGKLFRSGCYFQVEGSLKLGMSIPAAFRIALGTWASWIENTIDRNRTRVFIRTFEPSHWSDQPRRSCNATQYPMLETSGKAQNIFSDITLEVVKNMTFPVTILDVTSLSALRSDAHVGIWTDSPIAHDCSHWCLPGVPDTWNEILLSQLHRDNDLSLE